MNQMPIDFHSRNTDPYTSHYAAARAKEFAGGQCAEILALLKTHGPLSPEQIGQKMGIEAYAVRKRLSDLFNHGLARPTGEIVPTASGRKQRIWDAH